MHAAHATAPRDRFTQRQLGRGAASACRPKLLRLPAASPLAFNTACQAHLCVGQQRREAARVGDGHEHVAGAMHDKHPYAVAPHGAGQALGLREVAVALQGPWRHGKNRLSKRRTRSNGQGWVG